MRSRGERLRTDSDLSVFICAHVGADVCVTVTMTVLVHMCICMFHMDRMAGSDTYYDVMKLTHTSVCIYTHIRKHHKHSLT